MKILYITTVFLGFAICSFSQEEAEACMPPSKKILKLITAGVNASDAQTAVDKFNQAIEMDEENATAYYEYAMYAYASGVKYYETRPDPRFGDRSLKKSEEMFKSALDICSDFHANCTYYLGVINYTLQDNEEAVRWFKEFEKFKHSDTDRYPENYTSKLSDAQAFLKKYEEDQEILNDEVPFEPKMVQKVSTPNDEYFPMISPDNELMFFTRKVDRKNLGDIHSNVVEEFTIAERASMTGPFTQGVPVKYPFNDGSFASYGAATMSVDNKEMILCACNPIEVSGQKYMNCDLYSTSYERSGTGGNDYQWTPLENLGDKINGKGRWDAQPSLSADGNTLYYTVNGPTTRNNDIFVVERNEDGSWGDARPFDEINTAGKDKSPFLHQDSETLYFVSQCSKTRKGVGGLDIFYTRKENGVWSEPKNIGYPINSEADELGLFVSIDGEVAYYSSTLRGDWNIYSFELYEEARPQAVAILKGQLKDENGEGVKDATIEVLYEGSDEVTTVKVNGDDGKYATIIKKNTSGDVLVTVKKDGHAFDAKVIKHEEIASNVAILGKDLDVRKLEVGGSYTINEILYPTSSSMMNDKSKFILKGFARFLNQNELITVAIQGHTDDVGDDQRNLVLSEERAQSVRDYLISLGVDKSRLTAKGFGETNPKAANNSAANRAKNRRTDFVIEGM
ncbi:MAG: OmpA family protein [Crocinitomicaceae bacterium]|nr:OmpA family protein [Flavobacteriales bacterium]NQZ34362.1 OmpA family protein [Crocinitomicaceae bacterium]